ISVSVLSSTASITAAISLRSIQKKAGKVSGMGIPASTCAWVTRSPGNLINWLCCFIILVQYMVIKGQIDNKALCPVVDFEPVKFELPVYQCHSSATFAKIFVQI